MSSCGGSITTQTLTIGAEPQQVAGKLDARTRLTVIADAGNKANVWITSTRSNRNRDGFPLAPGAGYAFEDRGARAELFAMTLGAETQTLYVITEGE